MPQQLLYIGAAATFASQCSRRQTLIPWLANGIDVRGAMTS